MLIWGKIFSDRTLRFQFLGSFILLLFLLFSLTQFLDYVENRAGIVLYDPLLELFNPVDLTWLTFFVLYSSIITVIIRVRLKPDLILLGVQTYFLMVIFRIICMYLVPLDPPSQMILLKDPLVEIIGGTGKTLTRDLFFSGHTATMFILYLIAKEERYMGQILLLGTIIVGLLVLIQHVHYTIDVLAAIIFSYTSYFIIKRFKRKTLNRIRNYYSGDTVNNSQNKRMF